MATQWISPTWRMPENSNQSKFENYSLNFGAALEHIMLGDAGHDTNLLPGKPTGAGTVNNPIFSVSAFFNFDSAISGSLRNIIGAGQTGGATYWYLRKNASDNIEFVVRTIAGSPYYVTVTGSTVLNSDQWYHAAVSWDGTDITLYLNAASEATSGATTFYFGGGPGTEWPTIGSYYRGATTQSALWDGEIAQPCIFDHALTSDQITALYNSGTPVNPMALTPLPTAYYPLGGGSTGSASTLTVPNQAVPSATVFDFNSSSSQYVDLNSIDLGTTNTISFWHKRGNTTSNQHVLGSPDGTQTYIIYFTSGYIYIRPDGSTQFLSPFLGNTPYPFPPYKNTTDWANYIVTRNGDTIKLYLNGDEFALSGSGSGMAATTINAIANKGVGVSNTLDGEMSNMVVWNSDQTAEISNIYNSGIPATSYTNTPTAWYKLNVDTSTWDGTEWVIGEAQANYSSALDFVAADNDYIDLGTNSSLDIFGGDFSASLWFKHSNASGGALAMMEIAGFSDKMAMTLGFTSNTGVGFAIGSVWATNAGTGFNDGEWHHMVATRTGTTYKIYVDSVDTTITITSPTGWAYNASAPLNRIGTGFTAATKDFNGELSNIAIYNTALDSSAVTALYNNGTPETSISSSPVSWWKLNNLTTGIQDSAGSNNGTNNGATVTDIQVSTLNGLSDGMTTANLVTSDLTRSIPYSSYSMVFDGTNDEIGCGTDSSLDITGNITLSGWINRDDNLNSSNIVAKWNSGPTDTAYILRVTSSGGAASNSQIEMLIRNDSGTVVTAIESVGEVCFNKWVQITGTYDGK